MGVMRLPVIVLSLAAFAAIAAAQSPDSQLPGFRASYLSAKKALAARPKDSKTRAAFVVAGDRLATATMTADSLPRKTKYADALRLYREVLRVDSTLR